MKRIKVFRCMHATSANLEMEEWLYSRTTTPYNVQEVQSFPCSDGTFCIVVIYT